MLPGRYQTSAGASHPELDVVKVFIEPLVRILIASEIHPLAPQVTFEPTPLGRLPIRWRREFEFRRS
jgi:hypothetical protein